MTLKEKKQINQLANLFYRMHGYNAGDNYDFSKARHPQEKAMFELAKVSKEFWRINDRDSKS